MRTGVRVRPFLGGMSQIVVDTDVASYIFKWHSSAVHYVNALRGSQLVLSFMSIAELRMGAWQHTGASGGASSAQDVWIAATALALDAPLATNNRHACRLVRNLRLVSI